MLIIGETQAGIMSNSRSTFSIIMSGSENKRGMCTTKLLVSSIDGIDVNTKSDIDSIESTVKKRHVPADQEK